MPGRERLPHFHPADVLQKLESVSDSGDPWALLKLLIPKYSVDRIVAYSELFRFDPLITRLDMIVAKYGDLIPEAYKLQLLRSIRKLKHAEMLYRKLEELPAMAGNYNVETAQIEGLFHWRFVWAIDTLGDLDREAKRRQAMLTLTTV